MLECGKSIHRRLREPAFHQRYFVGRGIDVGAGNDWLGVYAPLFPRIESVDFWDKPDGDAQTLPGVEPGTYDFVHSSHCLEHLEDPHAALARWLEVTRHHGHVIVLVPDWELYEHCIWPSRFNPDHRHAFTTYPPATWPRHWTHELSSELSLVDLPGVLRYLRAAVLKLELLEATFIEAATGDQTQGIVGECAIEFVLRKL